MFKKLLCLGSLFIMLYSGLCALQDKTNERLDEEQIAAAKEIHRRVLTLDAHVDIEVSFITPGFYQGQQHEKLFSYEDMAKGGMDAVFFAVYTAQGPRTQDDHKHALSQALEKYHRIHTVIKDNYEEKIGIALNTEDMRQFYAAGKKVCIIGMENGYPLGKDLNNVKRFYDLGCRYITLCHNGHNQLCDSHENGGVIHLVAISEYVKPDPPEKQRSVAKLRQELGFPKDEMKFLQIYVRSSPVKKSTYQERVAKINQEFPAVTVGDYVDQIEYAIGLIGIDHVGISSDFYETPYCIAGWKDVGETFNITLELVKRGYSEADIEKIWSGNLLRVWHEVERTAAKHQQSN